MSKIDCWFLDLAVKTPVSFRTIIPDDQCIIPAPYLTPSNLTTNQIIDILFRLFQDGFLLAIAPADLEFLDAPLINELLTKAFIPSREQIKTVLDRENFRDAELDSEFYSKELYFFLTEKGGKQWEFCSNPKWNKYFRRCIHNWESVSEILRNNYIPPNGSTLCCANRKIGEKIIAIEHLLERPQFIPYPIKDSAIWETLTPWNPTYWKTLPCGYAVSYQVKLVEVDENVKNPNEPQELIEEIKQARKWYDDVTNWYTRCYQENGD